MSFVLVVLNDMVAGPLSSAPSLRIPSHQNDFQKAKEQYWKERRKNNALQSKGGGLTTKTLILHEPPNAGSATAASPLKQLPQHRSISATPGSSFAVPNSPTSSDSSRDASPKSQLSGNYFPWYDPNCIIKVCGSNVLVGVNDSVKKGRMAARQIFNKFSM